LDKIYTIFEILCYKKCPLIDFFYMFPIPYPQDPLVSCFALDIPVNKAHSRRVDFLHEVPWKQYRDHFLE